MKIEELDIYYAQQLLECDTYDHEGDHIKADKLIMDLLDKLGLVQTVKAYNQVSDKFWYA